jgi:glycosyltransferase involved in cell wall biosynthesis/SAM-dependent methyltransferase
MGVVSCLDVAGGSSTIVGRPAQPKHRIKVLYVCTALNRGSGGEKHPLALARHLDKEKFDLSICVIESSSAAVVRDIEQHGIAIYNLNRSRRLYNLLELIRIVTPLYRLCVKIKPDIVQTHALHANLLGRPAARWAGVRVIISTENVLPDIDHTLWRRALNAPLHALNRLLDRSTQRIVVVSEAVRRWKDPRGTSPKVHVIPPPFDIDALPAAQSARSQAREGRAPVLGVVGRLSHEKGHRFLLAAMPEILAREPQAQLLIVGAGPLGSELRAQVEALALTQCVRFLGYLQAVHTAYSRMDILVVPSLSEAFPLVALEGMVMELPIVGADVGGLTEIILDGETGLLVPPGDSAALARACQYLLRNPDVGRQMGERGRRRVLEAFHPSQFVARHERLYVSAIDGEANHGRYLGCVQRRSIMTGMDFAADVTEGEERLSGQSLVHFRSRVKKAAHILEELTLLGIDSSAGLKVLCAGCGVGFVPYILARHTAWTFIGGELDEEYIGRHPWIRQRVRISRLDLTAMPFPDDTFDLVICNHVIEHVPAWETLVQELHRVVRVGGLVYVATPNIYRPTVPLRIMLSNKERLSRDTRIALHLGFAVHELRRLFAHFSQLHNFNRTHASINSPSIVKPLLPLLPSIVYDYALPTNVMIGRK